MSPTRKQDQSKYLDEKGVLRYSADGGEVFFGPSGMAEPAKPALYTSEQVSVAINRAAGEVAEFRWAGDEEDGRDGANLTVNLAMTFLERPDATVREAIESCYSDATADYLLDLSPED